MHTIGYYIQYIKNKFIYLLHLIIFYLIIFLIGDTPKRKQLEQPDLVNTTLRREITQNYLVNFCEQETISSPSSTDSNEFSLIESESNLPSKENSPKAKTIKVIDLYIDNLIF